MILIKDDVKKLRSGNIERSNVWIDFVHFIKL